VVLARVLTLAIRHFCDKQRGLADLRFLQGQEVGLEEANLPEELFRWFADVDDPGVGHREGDLDRVSAVVAEDQGVDFDATAAVPAHRGLRAVDQTRPAVELDRFVAAVPGIVFPVPGVPVLVGDLGTGPVGPVDVHVVLDLHGQEDAPDDHGRDGIEAQDPGDPATETVLDCGQEVVEAGADGEFAGHRDSCCLPIPRQDLRRDAADMAARDSDLSNPRYPPLL